MTSGTVQITGVGGTSASSPAFAAIMALINQKYGPQGQADYMLYPLAKQYTTAFNDVTMGTNSVPCNVQTTSGENTYPPNDCIPSTVLFNIGTTDPTYGNSLEGQIGNTTTRVPEYNAGVGYDLASGLGTIDANNLVTNWGNVKLAATSVTLSTSQTTFAHGTTVTISGMVTPGAATGEVALETTSSEPLSVGATPFTIGANGAYSGGVNYLPGGTYDIYGTYSGDGSYAASTSSKTAITVTPESSATSLHVLNSSGAQVSTTGIIPYGTQLLLEAEPGSVTYSNTTSTPTGSINYLNGTSAIGTASVDATGAAELNYAPFPNSTPYSITAKYSGDASYNASTSAATTFTVGKDTPSLSLTSGTEISSTLPGNPTVPTLTVDVENTANANASEYAVNAAVAPTGVVTVTGLPGGTLTFPALSSGVDPGTLSIEGIATLLLATEAPSTYAATISYPGDANYAATTASVSIILAPIVFPTTTTATASASNLVPRTPTVTFLVTGTPVGGPPTGTVTFFASGSSVSSITIPSGGTGDTYGETLSLQSPLATGANQITVSYSGSPVYLPSEAILNVQNPVITLSNGGPITLAAGGAAQSSSISVAPMGGFTGIVALACTVTGSGAGAPTCAVNSPLTISNSTTGIATLTVTSTAATAHGVYTVTVTGTGTGDAAATTTVAVTVTAATALPALALTNSGSITLAAGGATVTSIISMMPTGGFTGAVALTCAVTGTGSSAPACTVNSPLTISGTAAGTSTLSVTSTATTTPGAYTATVTGTGTAAVAATTTVAVTINGTTQTPSVALGDGGSITIASAGGSGTAAISVTPSGAFSGNVALACVVMATSSDTPTCSILPSSVSVNGTTAGSATLMVNTTAASAALASPRMRMLPIGGGIAAALLLLLVPMKRRRILTLMGALVSIAVVGFSVGCGSAGSPDTGGGNSGTPVGTYTVSVSGTATGVTITPVIVAVMVQ